MIKEKVTIFAESHKRNKRLGRGKRTKHGNCCSTSTKMSFVEFLCLGRFKGKKKHRTDHCCVSQNVCPKNHKVQVVVFEITNIFIRHDKTNCCYLFLFEINGVVDCKKYSHL